MIKYTAIWQSSNPKEREWVDEIFGAYISEHVVDGKHEVVLDNSILFDAFLYWQDPAYYRRFRGRNAFLVDFLDECYQGGTYAVYRNFRGVFRNFWSDVFNPDQVMTLPLGYTNDTRRPDAVPTASARQFVWALLGDCSKSSRPDTARALSRIEPHFLYLTDAVPGFTTASTRRRLSRQEYQQLLLNSTFVPCPMGNVNIESYRTFEALESGAIPIVENRLTLDYYRQLLGQDFPGLVVKSWREAHIRISRLLTDPSEMDALQKRCIEWWDGYKKRYSSAVGAFLERRSHIGAVTNPIRVRRTQLPFWQQLELIRHHSLRAFCRRIDRQFSRLVKQKRWRAFRIQTAPSVSKR